MRREKPACWSYLSAPEISVYTPLQKAAVRISDGTKPNRSRIHGANQITHVDRCWDLLIWELQ